MSINRKVVERPKKRDRAELIKKHEKIGQLLTLDPVPTHTLAWKEDRLELDTGDCYPIVDVLERIATYVALLIDSTATKVGEPGEAQTKTPKPKKVK